MHLPVPLLFLASLTAAAAAQDVRPTPSDAQRGGLAFLGDAAGAQDAKPAWSDARQQGVAFLLQHQQDGVFSVEMGGRSFPDPGFTALALAALQSKPAASRSEAEQRCIDQGMTWLVAGQNADGSFGQRVTNYTTCAVVMALSRWPDDAKQDALAKAQRFVLALQYAESNGTSPTDLDYGGIGYGSKGERSDLSNVQFAIGALRQTGLPEDHEAFRRAIVFLQRTQNLKSVNDQSGKIQIKSGDGAATAPLAVGDDGGAVYYPGESPAGYVDHPDGSRTPRSYGSMTYALLKCYTLCGVRPDDPRVQAAVRWIGANWSVTENPGSDPRLGEAGKHQGLYYCYLLMAQALDTMKVDRVAATRDGKVVQVDWRAELKRQLESQQRADGAWVNGENGRWYESLDILCTCYALLALEACR